MYKNKKQGMKETDSNNTTPTPRHECTSGSRQFWIWTAALVAGTLLGVLGVEWIDALMQVVATVFTRLFRLVAVPVIALAVTLTIARFGAGGDARRLFRRTLTYTLLTTVAATVVGMLLYRVISPDNLPSGMARGSDADVASARAEMGDASYMDHLLGVIPDNLLQPFVEGNVLSVLLMSVVVGVVIARMPLSPQRDTILSLLTAMQEIVSTVIRWLIRLLPLGIVAYAARLSAEMSAGMALGSIGKYVAVILGGNLTQMFLILPLFLLARRINPLKVARAMSPAVLMALFTKSSAATLPVTIESSERLGVSSRVARFVLPVCTTINMNGCAAFIYVTSLFVMQHGGAPITWSTMLLWIPVAVIAAIGNAGVPMGCYFLTLSLVSGVGGPVEVMGVILPVFTMIDMVETAENVWSDSCVAAMVDRDDRS